MVKRVKVFAVFLKLFINSAPVFEVSRQCEVCEVIDTHGRAERVFMILVMELATQGILRELHDLSRCAVVKLGTFPWKVTQLSGT